MISKRLIGGVCIIGSTICYGLMPSVSFFAFEAGSSTETLLFDKFLYAAILMWSYILIKKIPYKISRNVTKSMMIVVSAYLLTSTAIYFAFDYISGTLATLIQFTYPAMVVVAEIKKEKYKPHISKIIAVLLSVIGLVFIVWSPSLEIKLAGVVLALAAAMAYSIYILGLASESLCNIDARATSAYVLTGAAGFNFFRCLASNQPLFTETPEQAKYIAILAIICAFVAIWLFCTGVKYIGPGNAAIISTLEPVFVCVFGYSLVGDDITAGMILGGVFIIAAILFTNVPKSRTVIILPSTKCMPKDDYKADK